MWQRFTESARKAVFYAQEEAQKYKQGWVATEHLLLGVLRTKDPSVSMLLDGVASAEQIAQAIEGELEKSLPDSYPTGEMILNPRAKRAIDLAYGAARDLGSSHIGCEHLLLGISRAEGAAAWTLEGLGATYKEMLVKAAELPSSGVVQSARPEPKPPSAKEMLHIRQQRYALDRLALMLLADDSVRKHLESRSVPVKGLQSALEELIASEPTKEDLYQAPPLAGLLEDAQKLVEGPIGWQHVFTAIALDERSYLNALMKDLGTDPKTLS